MSTKCFPTVNDVGGAGSGKVITEANITALVKMLLGQAFVLTGFTVPASSVNLTLSVALGEAMIAGYRVVKDAAETVTCSPSATNHIYLKLTRDASQNVTGAVFEVNTTGVAPADSVKIATAVAGASSVTSTTDARVLMPFASSQVSGVATQAGLDAHTALAATAHGGIVASSDVVTTATANKILKLDAAAKLPTSITGDAGTVDGAHAGTAAGNVLLLDGTGKVPPGNLPPGPSARAYNSADQSIADITVTALAFDSERFDTDAIHDPVTNNSRMACKTAGKYAVVANLRHTTLSFGNNTIFEAYIRLNGTAVVAKFERLFGAYTGAGVGYTLDINLSTILDLVVNDYLEVIVYHNLGSAQTIKALGNYTPEFMIARVG